MLAAGLGTRLRPYTESWPKCLMPINGYPLLEYWLSLLKRSGIEKVLVNLHHHKKHVLEFLRRPSFINWVQYVHEENLLGTAGTLRDNISFYKGDTILLIHADNLCCCDFQEFINFHFNMRPSRTLMTMMTFNSANPSECGIVELNEEGVVLDFHEKVENPPGNLANAAVYLIEPELTEWVIKNPDVSDFSTEVLPNFYGKIATWHNKDVLRDIGTIEMLREAQNDKCIPPAIPEDDWARKFKLNPIHMQIQ